MGIVWMDLIFDLQTARGSRAGGNAREQALAAVSTYYRHATGGMRGLSNLIAVVMLIALAVLVVQLLHENAPWWVSTISLIAAGFPMVRALITTLPCAIKLGKATPEERAPLARRVLLDHLVAALGLALAILVQLAFG
jgi:hypothetical protein